MSDKMLNCKLFLLLSVVLTGLCLGGSKAILAQDSVPHFETVRALIPADILAQQISDGRNTFLIISETEFSAMKAAKETWLAERSQPEDVVVPVPWVVRDARFSGTLVGHFMRVTATFSIELFDQKWHSLDLLSGTIALEQVTIDGTPAGLDLRKGAAPPRSLVFGRLPVKPGHIRASDLLQQNNWQYLHHTLCLQGQGRHSCSITFLAPVEEIEDRFQLSFGVLPVPLTFVQLEIPTHLMAISDCSFSDYAVQPAADGVGCSFQGWLGATGKVSMTWRRRQQRTPAVQAPTVVTAPITSETTTDQPESSSTTASPTIPTPAPAPIPAPDPVITIKPLVYARSQTAYSLADSALQGSMEVVYSISKAPVASFSFFVPGHVDIINVSGDRPLSKQTLREGSDKRLVVDFGAAREERCSITITFEMRIDKAEGRLSLPEIVPQHVDRELGSIGVQALTSVEIQPVALSEVDDTTAINVDPSELASEFQQKFQRPMLLACRFSGRPLNVAMNVRRYADVSQQTVTADQVDLKTMFTTNQTGMSLLTMRLRNNNKQTLQLQLASGTEILNVFRNGQAIQQVGGRGDGLVSVPLLMSQKVGEPRDMELRLTLRHPVPPIGLKTSLQFSAPLIDVPVSRFTWTMFAPTEYRMCNFMGTLRPLATGKTPFFFRGYLCLYDWLVWSLLHPGTMMILLLGGAVALLVLARDWLIWLGSMVWQALCGLFRVVISIRGFRLVELLIVAGIIAMLAAIATPNFRRAREQARDKACYATQRVLLGAVEMYNMDHQEPMTTRLDIPRLCEGQYLKGDPTRIPGCSYAIVGDITTNNGHIYCTQHGSVEHDLQTIRAMSTPDSAASSMGARADAFAAGSPLPGSGSQPGAKPGFGAVRGKGHQPLAVKFVTSDNFVSFQRDLVLVDVSSQGALLSNATCPTLGFTVLRSWTIICALVLALILGVLAGVYFVSSCITGYWPKAVVSLAIILLLSLFDRVLEEVGSMANYGWWGVLAAAMIWKTAVLIDWRMLTSLVGAGNDGDDDGDSPTGPGSKTSTPKPPKGDFVGVDVRQSPLPQSPEPHKSGYVLPLLPLILSIIIILLAAAPAGAESPRPQSPRPQSPRPQPPLSYTRQINLYLPFTELKEVIGSESGNVVVSLSDYHYLRDIKPDPEPPAVRNPQDYRIRRADYTGRVEEKGLRLTGNFTIDLLNDGWKSITLLPTEVVPAYVRADGEEIFLEILPGPTSLGWYGLRTAATGTMQIQTSFFLADADSELANRRFRLPLRQIGLTTLELEVPGDNMEIWCDPGRVEQVERGNGFSLFRMTLPPTETLTLEIAHATGMADFPVHSAAIDEVAQDHEDPEKEDQSSIASDTIQEVLREETRVVAHGCHLFSIEEGYFQGRYRFDLDITGDTGIGSLTFSLPEKVRIRDVVGAGVADWNVIQLEGVSRPRLEVFFIAEMKKFARITVEFENDLIVREHAETPLPEIIPLGIDRTQGIIGVSAPTGLDLSVETSPEGFNPTDAGEFVRLWNDAVPEKLPFAFTYFQHSNRLTLTLRRSQELNMVTAVIDQAEAMTLLNEEGFLLTRVVYELRNNSEQFLKIKLPALGSQTAELWSSEVGGMSVRAGFDHQHGVFNIPILRSMRSDGEPLAFPVSIIYAFRLRTGLFPITPVRLELPAVHLDVSALSWVLYLPESYELMRGKSNVDRLFEIPQQPLLSGSRTFPHLSVHGRSQPGAQGSFSSTSSKTGILGLLPVKFNIPTTPWTTGFSMSNIQPDRAAPFVQGTLITPNHGFGLVIHLLLFFLGGIAGVATLALVTMRRPWLSLLTLALSGGIMAVTLLMKMYLADYSFKIGYLVVFFSLLIRSFLRYDTGTKQSETGDPALSTGNKQSSVTGTSLP